jgi:hypothetical protein
MYILCCIYFHIESVQYNITAPGIQTKVQYLYNNANNYYRRDFGGHFHESRVLIMRLRGYKTFEIGH